MAISKQNADVYPASAPLTSKKKKIKANWLSDNHIEQKTCMHSFDIHNLIF